MLADLLSERIACVGLSRSSWLYELMTAEYPEAEVDRFDCESVFQAAQKYGVIEYYTAEETVKPLTRRFVCATLVRACGYEAHGALEHADVTDRESYMSVAAYYGFFLPDKADKLYPDAQITAEEFGSLKQELDRRALLKGKTALSFGDSIMYGSGNDGDGMGEMIAAKYGMTCTDYSVPGATMGIYGKHGHIPNQPRQAKNEHRTADVIFLDGGTNDMLFTKLGKISSGLDMSKISEQDFSGGFEKCMWMIRENWGDVPVIYVRAHNMNVGADAKEQKYGEQGLEIAKKWGAVTIDLYNDSPMNTENPLLSSLYTSVDARKKIVTHDSIHPTALGYTRYYLPPLAQALTEVFG